MSAQQPVGQSVNRDSATKLGPKDLGLRLGDFACEALTDQAARLGVPSEELARFSVMYYLADLDSGRAARRRLPYAYTTATHSL